MVEQKAKKKHFVKITAPKQFNEQVIGESPVEDARLLLGRKVKVNMMSITNDPKSQNVQIHFKISALKGEGVTTEIVGYTLLPSFVKRLVRKEKVRVDDSFKVTTKDGKILFVKPFLLTLNKTTQSVATSLRREVQKSIKSKVSVIGYEEFISDLVSHKFQNILRKELSKIYPLKQCEVRDLQVIGQEEVNEKETKEKPKKSERPKKEKKEEVEVSIVKPSEEAEPAEDKESEAEPEEPEEETEDAETKD